jgi:hypothetical protein
VGGVQEHGDAGVDQVVLNLLTKDPSKPYPEEARLLAGV